MKKTNSMQTPLAKVRGLGSAKSGLHHWWHQRLTAIAMVPLMIATLVIISQIGTLDYDGAMALMANPLVASLLLLLVLVGFYHAAMGLQVVLEDYVSSEGQRMALIIFVKMALFALAVLAILSILKIAL
ncbi:MAG: succinate dehydrogenase, hydrophobic membrane anchor protein [Candidatus Puniceispirillaceae bacterium]